MSNENINEAQVEQTASQETESINEAKATIEKYATQHSDDFTEEQLRELCEALSAEYLHVSESNANLIAERDNLMEEREQLQGKIASLEEKLKTEQEDRLNIYGWYNREQDKVRALSIIVKAMKSDFVTIDTIVDRIAKQV